MPIVPCVSGSQDQWQSRPGSQISEPSLELVLTEQRGTLQEEARSLWPVPVPVLQFVGFVTEKWQSSCSALISVHRDAVSLSVQHLPEGSSRGLSLPPTPDRRQL